MNAPHIPGRVLLTDVRQDYFDYFEAVQYQGAGRFRTGGKFLIEKGSAQAKLCWDAIKEVTEAKWKDKAQGIVDRLIKKDDICLHDGDETTHEYQHGHYHLSANCAGSETAAGAAMPVILNAAAQRVGLDKNQIYRGCYVKALVEFYADDRYNKTGAVHCKLLVVQFWRDAPAFAAAVSLSGFDPSPHTSALEGADAEDIG